MEKQLVGITMSYSDGSEVIILPDGDRFTIVRPKAADPAPARLQQTREKLEKEAPAVAAAAEVQAGPQMTMPEMRLALRDAWMKAGGDPDDTKAMWHAMNPVLNRKPSDQTPYTAVEIGRLLARPKSWAPKKAELLNVEPEQAEPQGLQA